MPDGRSPRASLSGFVRTDAGLERRVRSGLDRLEPGGQGAHPAVITPTPRNASRSPTRLELASDLLLRVWRDRYLSAAGRSAQVTFYNETALPNAYYTPLVADQDRHFASIGAAYQAGIGNSS